MRPATFIDLSIYCEFVATERITLQFRVEAFNVTNTALRSAPRGLRSSMFGVITSAGLPRSIQLLF
ncbi:MAG TPA: hypothetical protein VGL72_20515 [Bryobacteraceae bacterium]|jgi:hypothetical protein